MKNIQGYIGVFFFLLVVLLIGPEGNITGFGWRLNLLTGGFFVALFYLTYLPSDANITLKIKLIIHNILFILLLIILPAFSRIPLLALSAFVLYFMLKKNNQNHPEINILAIATIFFFTYLMIYHYWSGLWYLIQSGSQALSWLTSNIIQQPVNLNPSYSGLHISILFLICSYCCIWFIKSNRIGLLILSLVYIFVATVVYIIFQLYFPGWVLHHFHAFWVHSLHSRVLLFLLLIPLIIWLFSKVDVNIPYIQNKISRCKLLAKTSLYLIIFVSFFILTFKPSTEPANRSVLFYDNGYLDWRLPDHNNYGAKNGGMFGMLPVYLEAKDYHITHDSVINKENLVNTDILVVVNLLLEFNEKEKLLIWDFVDKGGSLLVLGDHTGFKKIREPTNDLLEPFNIALNFDCAIPFVESWRNSMKFFPHFITSSVNSNYVSNIFIGASLTISPPARPLITGKFGFSDPGNPNAPHNGYLGDMKYLQGEQLGDQVLVAETLYGKGKVLVFGDTSPFQNSALVQSHTFVDDVFRWLSAPLTWHNRYYSILFIILLIVALAGLLLLKMNLYDFMIISATILLAILMNTLSFQRKIDIDQMEPGELELAVIDASHLERFSLNQWENNGYGGLCYNLMRAGFMPLLSSYFNGERIKESRFVVLISPAKSFKKSEIKMIGDFVRDGGFLLIASGWEESKGSEKLLNEFGLHIDNIPLGKVDPDQNIKMLTFTKAWALSATDKNYDILCEVWGQPTIIYKPVGDGGILLIGDSGFLLNENLEGMESFNSQNILFFKEIIEMYYK